VDFFFLKCGQNGSDDENANKPVGIVVLVCPDRCRNISTLLVFYFILLYFILFLGNNCTSGNFYVTLHFMPFLYEVHFFYLDTSGKHYEEPEN